MESAPRYAAESVNCPAAESVDPTDPSSSVVSFGRLKPQKDKLPPWLDATHTASESRVYSNMYRQTISKGISSRRFKVSDLMDLTGIRSRPTICKALTGLKAKLSIAVVTDYSANRLGIEYRVRGFDEIFSERRTAGIEIDRATKRIISRPSGSLAGSLVEPDLAVQNQTSSSLETEPLAVQKINCQSDPALRYHEIGSNELLTPSSSPPTGDDKLPKVRPLFDQLSNGGQWKDERDLPAFRQIESVQLWHIIMGLCYSVSKSPEHKMSCFGYAVPSILEHFKQMGVFDSVEMIEVAYRQMRKTLLCIAQGKWTVSEWEQ